MITIFGSINLDLIGGVDRLPRPGETVPGSAFDVAPGGKGANQALAAARAGARVAMIGAVGSDGFSEPALELLHAGGVDLSRVRKVEGTTGVALILVEAGGENVIAVIPGANATMGERDSATLAFSKGDVLLVQLEVPVPAVEAAVRRAREADARVVLNFAPFREDALALIPHATHLVVNESECDLVARALGLAVGSLEQQATVIARHYAMTVIVTLGKDGVLAVAGGRTETAPALKVDAIDTVGAGDTFCGYFAAALAEDMPLAKALTFAAAAGSLACTKAGAQPAIPMRSEVERVLAD